MELTGAEIVVQSLKDEGVEYVFGYPGGAVLHIYDAFYKQDDVKHILVRHEQGATHAADGYARATGKPGVVLVTSGPGATNAVTGIATAYMDSVPMVILTGQVPTALIGNDAFQEVDNVGITRPCVKHNFLVKDVKDLAETIKKAFYIAATGRPGPVLVDIPKDITADKAEYAYPETVSIRSYNPVTKGHPGQIKKAVDLMLSAKQPMLYTGGGVVQGNASGLLTELIRLLGYPITNTLMGLGAYPATDRQFLGMLGMHGTYEANLAMHGCDVMVAVGARFDDRVTGRLDAFSPNSAKIQIDIDPSSINKNVAVDVAIVGDVGHVLEDMIKIWKSSVHEPDKAALSQWWRAIDGWRAKDCLAYRQNGALIKPQHAIQRLYDLTRDREPFITTEVGQHQMWAAQYFRFEKPNHWMTSGGLGTMGYGLPAAVGAQVAHPDDLVIDIAGEASILMNIQEMSTVAQYHLPVKIFILNNEYMGMVRQWQELLHGGRYAESYMASLPDFVKLAESFHGVGLRAETPADLDDVIREMISIDKPVIADIRVEKMENCFPMVPSGAAHNEMMLGTATDEPAVSDDGLALV